MNGPLYAIRPLPEWRRRMLESAGPSALVRKLDATKADNKSAVDEVLKATAEYLSQERSTPSVSEE